MSALRCSGPGTCVSHQILLNMITALPGNRIPGSKRPMIVRRLPAIASIATVLLFASACGSDGGTAGGDPGSDSSPKTEPSASSTTVIAASGLLDRQWDLESTVTVAGAQPVPEDSAAALTFGSDGTLRIIDGCNGGGGPFTVTDDEITFGSITTTAIGCGDEVNALASAIHLVLRSPVTWAIDGEHLTLTPTNISDSGLTLRDAGAVPPPPAPPPTTAPPVTANP